MASVIVAGIQRYGSGKTGLVLSLAKELRKLGLRVGASKPVSMTSLWYDYPILRDIVREGILTDKDSVTYSKLGLASPPSVSNPVNIVTAVPDPLRYGDIRTYLNDLDRPFSIPLLARVTIGGITKYFRIHDLEDRATELEIDILENLVDELGISVKDVSVTWFYSYLGSKEVGTGIAEVLHYLGRDSDILFIESVSTALMPVTALSSFVDALMIVVPGRALLYTREHVRAYVKGATSPNMLDTRHFIRFMKPALTAPLSHGVGAASIKPHRRLIKALVSLVQ